ncbi:MAG: mechanosensitive ion channel [Flavobacteriaceae bacterium]|nr:MAG: mechanosensitive ion channel [Flavobacteriaceae bacterium]
MNWESSQVLVSVLFIATAIVLKISTYYLIRKVTRKFGFKIARQATIARIINLALIFLTVMILLIVWEVNSEDLFLYLASLFTVLGIAFFHQRSHLSNITAGIMLFFSHRAKVGDFVTIHDADDTTGGKIEDIGLLFVTIISKNNDRIMISNTRFLQKTVSIEQLHIGQKTNKTENLYVNSP